MTFSIMAHCAHTNRLGVAIATKFLAVGGIALERRFGAGLCCTQAFVNPLYRHWTLEALTNGADVEGALAAARAIDPRSDLRQVVLGSDGGRLAAFTGEGVEGDAGHLSGDGFMVAGNMLASAAVLSSIKQAYECGADLPLERRLIAALYAGLQAGGDKRGLQSAALLVVADQPYAQIDLRIDDSMCPISELERLLDEYDANFQPILAGLATLAEPAGRLGTGRSRS